MKRSLLVVMMLVLGIASDRSVAVAQDQPQDGGPYEAYAGLYDIIGRYPDSQKTYTGTLLATATKDHLTFVRTIAGKKSNGEMVLKEISDQTVLEVSFVEGGKKYKGTFLSRVDTGNNELVSGWFWPVGAGSKKHGLESWFSKADE
jgi:hypothetical protein